MIITARPGDSLSAKARALRDGDTLVIRGEHDGGVTIKANHVKVQAKGATVDADDFEFAVRVTGHHVTVDGGEYRDADGAGLFIDGTHDVTVRGVESRDNGTAGIYARGSSEIKIAASEAHGNGTAGISIHVPRDHGPKDASPDITITGNRLYANGGNPAKPTEGWGLLLDGVKAKHAPDGRWCDTYDGQTIVKGNDAWGNKHADYATWYVSNARFIDNDADSKGGSFWFGHSDGLYAEGNAGSGVKVVETDGVWIGGVQAMAIDWDAL